MFAYVQTKLKGSQAYHSLDQHDELSKKLLLSNFEKKSLSEMSSQLEVTFYAVEREYIASQTAHQARLTERLARTIVSMARLDQGVIDAFKDFFSDGGRLSCEVCKDIYEAWTTALKNGNPRAARLIDAIAKEQ